jgi:peptidoglycan/xylan/chitin deacetylase (PgdA/CDA1 family)
MSTSESQPWEWNEPTWRRHVERVRAGRSLAPNSWPGHATAVAAVSFDSDHETPALRDGETRPAKLAQGEYGARVAVPKILDLLAKHGITASFFMPAVCALLRPAEARSYVDAGHELGIHGWIHERNTLLPAGVERDLQMRSADTLEQVTGVRPVGIRTPSWDFSEHTLMITREMGLLYDSSLMADDEPYELLEDGEATGVVEIPVEWIRDDAPYFMMERFASLRPYISPRDVLTIWKDEFDAAYAGGGIFQLTLHPHIIGHRSRLIVLDELLTYITGHDGVWFASHEQIARYCLTQCDARTEDSTMDRSSARPESDGR